MTVKAKVNSTGETLDVYRLENGNWYDYDGMGEHALPTAPKAGKKEFKPSEINFIK